MFRVAIIGGGPAGLMAADQLSTVNGIQVDVFEAMPRVDCADSLIDAVTSYFCGLSLFFR